MFKKGFTLIELAIVVVIIGLLVGGVLAGQELVKQAKIRSQIRQFSDYDAAIIGFRGKYGFLPGDIPISYATRFNLSTNATGMTVPPNGNGLINDDNGNVPPMCLWPEPKYFFTQLSEANFIKGALKMVGSSFIIGETFPSDQLGKYSGIIALSLPDGGLYYFMGASVQSSASCGTNDVALTPVLTPEIAWNLDTKLDDGIPGAGNIRAVTTSNTLATNLINDVVANNCIATDNTSYNLVSEKVVCKIVVRSKGA